jgi:hypothetical protein
MLEALCRQSSTTLDIVHAEDGPPITQRTSGLVFATNGRERGYACSRRHSAQPSGVTSSWIDPYPSSGASIIFVWHLRTKGTLQGTYVRYRRTRMRREHSSKTLFFGRRPPS